MRWRHAAGGLMIVALACAAGCGGSGSNKAAATALTAPPTTSQAAKVGKEPKKLEVTDSAPKVKATHEKGLGHQPKLPRSKVCPPGQAKKARCTSTVASDKHGTPLTFPKPDVYSMPGIYGTVWGFGPKDFHTAYNLPWYANVQQTIGIVIWNDDPTVKKDLDFFDSTFGLGTFPTCTSWTWSACFIKVNQRGYTTGLPAVDKNVSIETSLDVQYTHSTCLNCRIILVEADSNNTPDLAAAENMAYRLGATVINNSWGAEEGDTECTTEASKYASAFNHPGVAIVASSGDSGYGAQCPADMNTVVAVGGTDLNLTSTGAYSSESVYAQEDIFGDVISGPGSGCSAVTTRASFQATNANWSQTGCGTRRGITDVSASYGGTWIYDTTAGYNNDPTNGEATGNSYWYVVYGTSLAAPIISGAYGLAGNGWTVSYPAQLGYQHPGSFRDITSGNNGSCVTIMCQAGRGYDGPTGLGTPYGLGGF